MDEEPTQLDQNDPEAIREKSKELSNKIKGILTGAVPFTGDGYYGVISELNFDELPLQVQEGLKTANGDSYQKYGISITSRRGDLSLVFIPQVTDKDDFYPASLQYTSEHRLPSVSYLLSAFDGASDHEPAAVLSTPATSTAAEGGSSKQEYQPLEIGTEELLHINGFFDQHADDVAPQLYNIS